MDTTQFSQNLYKRKKKDWKKFYSKFSPWSKVNYLPFQPNQLFGNENKTNYHTQLFTVCKLKHKSSHPGHKEIKDSNSLVGEFSNTCMSYGIFGASLWLALVYITSTNVGQNWSHTLPLGSDWVHVLQSYVHCRICMLPIPSNNKN